eukprot:Amastigsp_a342902_46.p2 type:complete len:149 gc:universal Amastigsp_a342902_46:465-19(-)
MQVRWSARLPARAMRRVQRAPLMLFDSALRRSLNRWKPKEAQSNARRQVSAIDEAIRAAERAPSFAVWGNHVGPSARVVATSSPKTRLLTVAYWRLRENTMGLFDSVFSCSMCHGRVNAKGQRTMWATTKRASRAKNSSGFGMASRYK